MPAELNFFDTYTLMAVQKRIVPKQTFFRDRYFPTEEGDIFSSNKVLTEYMDGDRKMAAFVSPRVGAIPMERMGYEVHEFEPSSIGVSRPLTSDDLTKRGFGEAIYANSTPAQRAAKLVQNDLADMDGRITRTEEWMCAQTMLDNGCVMQEMIDNVTKGEAKVVNFYNPGHENDHIYTAAHKWNEEGGNFFGDVPAMCRLLSKRGLRAADLLLGADVYDAVMDLEKVQRLLDKNSGMEAMLNFIPAPIAIALMLLGFVALAVGGIRLGYKATVKDLALELVKKAELSIMGSGQGAKKKKQVFAALRTKCPAAIRWAITDEVLDTVIEHAFDVMTAALGKKS